MHSSPNTSTKHDYSKSNAERQIDLSHGLGRYAIGLSLAMALWCGFSLTANAQINAHGCQAGMNCFYADRTLGSDANDGTAKVTGGGHGPWQNGPQMVCATGVAAAHAYNANDAYTFKGGEVWPNSCFGQWAINSGDAGTPTAHVFPGMYFGYDPTWNDGTVTSIRLTDSGDNCSAASVTITPASGDVTGSGATGTVTLGTNYVAGLAMWVTVTSPGSNYTLNPNVSFAGSTCNRLPSAQAFITSPVWGVAGTSFGTSSTLPNMIFMNRSYITLDGIDIGHYLWNSAYSSNSVAPCMLCITGGNHVLLQNMWLHHMGVTGAAQALNSTMDGAISALVNAQQADNTGNTLANSWLSNWEITSGGCANSDTGPCATQTLFIGFKNIIGNYFWGSRGNLYTVAGTNDHHVAFNTMWGCLDSTGTQHPDSYYLQGGGVTNNNILHDAYPGCAAFYIENANGSSPVAVGQPHWVFNNIIWNTGVSTSPVGGFTAEFVAAGATSLSPAHSATVVNNTILGEEDGVNGVSSAGTGICGNSGQWFGNSPALSWNFTIQNNVCMTSSSVAYQSVVATGCSPNGCGTWNGVTPPNGASGQLALNTPNVLITPASATTQGQVIANHFAPTSNSNSSVTFAAGGNSTNLTSSCSTSFNGISLAALCSDFNGNVRPSSGGWQAGAFQFTPGTTFALTVTVNGIGTVTDNTAAISCPGTCSANYASGTVVTLTATPTVGNTFSGWSGGGCSGTGTCVVTMSSAQAVTAQFNAAPAPAASLFAKGGSTFSGKSVIQ